LQCALEINNTLQDVKFGENITLSVKVGIGVGQISILHIGGVFGRVCFLLFRLLMVLCSFLSSPSGQMEYCATGEPLLQAFAAEHHASKKEVRLPFFSLIFNLNYSTLSFFVSSFFPADCRLSSGLVPHQALLQGPGQG
jgi:hypothetical protein